MADQRDMLDELIDAWTIQDVERSLRLFHDDIIFRLHVDPESHAFAGETRGKAAVQRLMLHVVSEFEYQFYQPTLLGFDGELARFQTTYRMVHRVTREQLSGSKRMLVRFRDGLVVEIEQFEDAPRVAAFMRLVASHVTSRDEVR